MRLSVLCGQGRFAGAHIDSGRGKVCLRARSRPTSSAKINSLCELPFSSYAILSVKDVDYKRERKSMAIATSVATVVRLRLGRATLHSRSIPPQQTASKLRFWLHYLRRPLRGRSTRALRPIGTLLRPASTPSALTLLLPNTHDIPSLRQTPHLALHCARMSNRGPYPLLGPQLIWLRTPRSSK